MIPIKLIIAVLVAHFVADFVLQHRNIAKLKSSSMQALTAHIIWYCFGMFVVLCAFGVKEDKYLLWLAWNAAAHWVVDFFTSRGFKKYWPTNEWLAVCIYGLDQTLHLGLLFWTLTYIT